MRTDRNYSLRDVVVWTWRETAFFLSFATTATALYDLAGARVIAIPWVPVALIGSAVAFITGFKNNASYDRLWEARKVWGGLVNTSRYFATQAIWFLSEDADGTAGLDIDAERRRLVYRVVAFLTALRYQLRQPRVWETVDQVHNANFRSQYVVAEWEGNLEDELGELLAPEELQRVLAAPNRATQVMALQSEHLSRLVSMGVLDEFRRVQMSKTVSRFFDEQGRAERIKNFPYPRQFATLNLLFIWLFILLVPFGLLSTFDGLGPGLVWLAVPASTIVCWVFHTMEKIGSASENPFEGGANDVPITATARTIEVDLRSMLGEADLPKPIEAVNNVLT